MAVIGTCGDGDCYKQIPLKLADSHYPDYIMSKLDEVQLSK